MKILYIDDDTEDADLFCEVIKEIDPAIICTLVSSGGDGLKMLDNECPDFIFIDYRMPAMDGTETLNEIRKHPCFSKARIVMYSTYMSRDQIDECKKSGAHICLRKRGEFQLMMSEIRAVLFNDTDAF